MSARAGAARARGGRLALVLGVAGLCAAFTTVKDPGNEASIRWGSSAASVTVQEDGSDDVSDGSDLSAVEAAAATWTAACSDLALTVGGTSQSGVDADDGVNRIAFRESSWPGGMNGAVASTVRRRDAAADAERWSDVDILLNGVHFSWATDGDPHRHDIQSIVTHELGHLLGFQHAASPTATMYFGGRPGHTWGRSLDDDDLAALCFLYPADPPGCADDADCPLLDGAYGGGDLRTACLPGRVDCLFDADCPGANGVCPADIDGRYRCRQLCLLDEHCASEEVGHGGTGETAASLALGLVALLRPRRPGRRAGGRPRRPARRHRVRLGAPLGLLLALAGVTACPKSEPRPEPSVTERDPAADPKEAAAEVRALLKVQAADWTAGDLEAFCSVYAEDAVFLSPSGVTRGRQQILDRYHRRYREGGAEMGGLTLEVLDARVGPSADKASVALRWTLRFAEEEPASGLSLITLVREGDTWMIEQDASM